MTTSARFLFASRNVHVVWQGGQWGTIREGQMDDPRLFRRCHGGRQDAVVGARKTAKAERVDVVEHDRQGVVISREQFH